MPLTVLSDGDVNRILHSFTRDDILELQQSLADALHWYSTSNDANDCCSDFQPERTHLKRKDGSTTLFMPASAMSGQGIKVVNIVPPETSGLPALTENLSLKSSGSSVSSARDSFSAASRSSTDTSQTTASSATPAPNSPAHANPPQGGSGQKPPVATIKGSLTLLDAQGNTTALINASELTAFRTALASTLLLQIRQSVHEITVFGAGKQAYWHTRLALLLRPKEIHHLNLVTRSFDSAQSCMLRLRNPFPDDDGGDANNGFSPAPLDNSRTQKTILTPAHIEYDRLLKSYVRNSNAIFCTTPSSSPLFPGTHLTNPSGRKKGRYIACVGSYKPSMLELDPEVLRDAVAPHGGGGHVHLQQRRQREGGAVVVDTVSGCLREAGEVIQARLRPDQVVELGELFMLKREAERLREERAGKVGKTEKGCEFQESSGLRDWLTKGNVIYKSVGLGLMDVVVGNEVVSRARARGIGVTVDDF
ncbi:hypothetical protein B0A50_00136 [Salinomyces thailandicus]|uniref:NAD(P)-binding protein n=1 Tax=Salinomyces thailandicus TaxID=706561 RepID=A0A4U0UHE8_9PEZI|nr:hypothetical protein B0A50_00136 [Salinomyces thailandica]